MGLGGWIGCCRGALQSASDRKRSCSCGYALLAVIRGLRVPLSVNVNANAGDELKVLTAAAAVATVVALAVAASTGCHTILKMLMAMTTVY